ncbi:hypothetical protein [Variovorax sp. Root318D1]|uniref:hypothetical protein n=1 Tax=Variovorax sp. Root318D1 TaxID=1736513 RepID=UPI001F3032D4|nr:hypothetical protein [Variovorax sp. Root318D1]
MNVLAFHLIEGIARAESEQHPSGLAEPGHQRSGRRDGRRNAVCAARTPCASRASATLAIATLGGAIGALATTAAAQADQAGQAPALSTTTSASTTAAKQEHRNHQCRNAPSGKNDHEKRFLIERESAAAGTRCRGLAGAQGARSMPTSQPAKSARVASKK